MGGFVIELAQIAHDTVGPAKDTYWSVLTSPAHLFAELTITAVTDGLLYPVVRLALRRHDRRHHPVRSEKAL